MKKCTKCGIEKPLTEFHKKKSSKDGHGYSCKLCSREYYVQNKEKIAKQGAIYRAKNKERRKRQQKEYNARPEVKEKTKKRQKEYLARPETIEMRKEYFARPEVKERIEKRRIEYESRPEIKEMREKYQTEYREENKDKIRVRQVKYYHKKGSKLKSFIYQIKNLKNNRIYIGETIRGKERIQKHFSCLRSQRHENYKLQQDFNEHGEDVFEWSILKELPKDKELLLLEEAREIQRRINNGEDLYNLMLTIEQLKMLTEYKEN